MSEVSAQPIAAVPYVVIGKDGDHYLIGSRCGQCGATLLGKRLACAACGATGISTVRLQDKGRIRVGTVINRSYPGVPVPFVAVLVDLDGGGVVRGTLRGAIPDDPANLVGQVVRVCIEDSGQRDASGRPFFCHVFRPLEATT